MICFQHAALKPANYTGNEYLMEKTDDTVPKMTEIWKDIDGFDGLY